MAYATRRHEAKSKSNREKIEVIKMTKALIEQVSIKIPLSILLCSYVKSTFLLNGVLKPYASIHLCICVAQ